MTDLPEIPLIDLGRKPPAALIDAAAGRMDDIMHAGFRRYGHLALRHGDRATRRWLKRNGNPYVDEIAEISDRVGLPGAWLLNLSYEWSCTSGVGPDPEDAATARLLRTLDWPMDGLGRNVVISRVEAQAGSCYNVTWPGFVGVLTAMAPGRFSAAINQPPMRRHTRSCWFDWLINRVGVWHKTGLPPAHLLRQVFDTCTSYEDAKTMLMEAPLCLPAFFTLAGCNSGEGCVIERTERRAAVLEAPAAVANHWQSLNEGGMSRGYDSGGRLDDMLRRVRGGDGAGATGFDWVTPPILNEAMRLSVAANAARASLAVQGWEADGPATAIFTL